MDHKDKPLGTSFEEALDTSNDPLGKSFERVLNASNDPLGMSFEAFNTGNDPLGKSFEDLNAGNDYSGKSFEDTAGTSGISLIENNATVVKDQDLFGLSHLSEEKGDQSRKSDDPLAVFDFDSESDESGNSLIVEQIQTSTPYKGKSKKQMVMFPDLTPLKAQVSREQLRDEESGQESISDDLLTEKDSENENLEQSRDEDNSANSLLAKSLITAGDVKSECERNCLGPFTLEDITSARKKFWTKTYKERTEWLMDKFEEAYVEDSKYLFTGKGGKLICKPCFCSLYKLHKNFFYRCRKKYESGHQSTGPKRRRRETNLKEDAICWLHMYAKYYADDMPDSENKELPYKYKKIAVYNKYRDENTDNMKPCIGRSTFMKMWNKDFTWLKIKKSNSFSKCDTCTGLERQMNQTREPKKREQIQRLIDAHNECQMHERQYYYRKRDQARKFPDEYMSIIIDGMDQSKTNLPHFTGRKSKLLDGSYMLKTHIQGVLNHGRDQLLTFVDINEYPHDANMVMNTILQVINDSITKDNKLPATLYIQADNCYRENKNKYVLGLCELLVRKNIFTEVHLSFLYVGHTHEDIDACFSKIADNLRKNDAETLVRLLYLLTNSRQLQGLFDIKTWLEPHLNNISRHSQPLHFKFRKTAGNEIEGSYKGQHDSEWILFPESILNNVPDRQPSILIPNNLAKIPFDEIEKTIDKSKHLMTDRESQKWWKRFIDTHKAVVLDGSKMQEYAENQAVWILDQLPTVTQPQEVPLQVAPEVMKMLHKHTEVPQVQIRGRQADKWIFLNLIYTEEEDQQGLQTEEEELGEQGQELMPVAQKQPDVEQEEAIKQENQEGKEQNME